MLKVFIMLASSILFVVSGETQNVTKVERDKQNIQSAPAAVSVDSRFFDIGQLFNPRLSNFNQNRPANSETNLQNTQFSPAQGNFPQNPNLRNEWGNQGNFRPSLNQGFNPQPPNGANQWQGPQFTNGGGLVRPNYPDVSNDYPMQRPDQYPGNNNNPSNWRPGNSFQGSNQLPNQFDSNQGRIWNQQRPITNPNQNRPMLFPGEDNRRPPNDGMNNYPSNNDQYPGNESQDPSFNPNQGSWQNPSNSGGGTLDDISPQINNGSGNNAILGKPVFIPPTTANPDQIIFNNSSESPLQRQCVQDCPATPEYNPICGTNNVTYFNPGKFVCARNCGVSVYVARRGVCRRRPM